MHDNILYLESHGWKRTGGRNGQSTGKCPHRDHTDKHPSFSINESSGGFKCFSCGFKGNSLVTLMMGVEGISYEQARERCYGEVISLEPTAKDAYHAMLDDCQKWFRSAINAQKEPLCYTAEIARQYLAKRKVESDTIGLSTGAVVKYLSKQGHFDTLNKTAMMDGGVYICGDRVTIPITHRNRIIGFSMRSLDKNSRAKYLNMVDTDLYPYNKWMFGLDDQKSDTVYVTEGVFDAIAVGGVALLGTNLSPERISLLHRFKNIYLLFDNDAGGWKAVEDFYFYSRGMLPNSVVKVVNLPCDPDECANVSYYVNTAMGIIQWVARHASRIRPAEAMVNEVQRIKRRADECYEMDDVERVCLNEFLVVECAMSLFYPGLLGSPWSGAWSEMCQHVEKVTGVGFYKGSTVADHSPATIEQVGVAIPYPKGNTGSSSSEPLATPDTLTDGEK